MSDQGKAGMFERAMRAMPDWLQAIIVFLLVIPFAVIGGTYLWFRYHRGPRHGIELWLERKFGW